MPTVLSQLTTENVTAAILEYDRLGREAFLKLAGFKPSTRFYIRVGMFLYDIKAIAGRAARAPANTFSSGEALVRKIESLGFKVTEGARVQATDTPKAKRK